MTQHAGKPPLDRARVQRAYDTVREQLDAERAGKPYWEGELSPSALAVAVAVSAMSIASNAREQWRDRFAERIVRGLDWLRTNRNDDGGWGDTPISLSNGPTTLLALAALRLNGVSEDAPQVRDAAAFVARCGGVEGIAASYGSDRTFSVPIVTTAALAKLAVWRDVIQLPFELAALPRWLFTAANMRVVSYALPALISMGLLRFRKGPQSGWLSRWIRNCTTGSALRRLDRITPSSGGFLEAIPLTAFVVMTLIAADLPDHPSVEKGLAFLESRQRSDGSWPIDSNLSIWCTTLAVNGLGGGSVETRDWLLDQQQTEKHPFTGAAPGGWGWTHLSGSVPDADDTAGALLALRVLPECDRTLLAVAAGFRWLTGLQNRDGGIPTFCRGWQRLPFDQSAPELTAHFLRACSAWEQRLDRSQRRAKDFLASAHTWTPLWFGNEAAEGKRNPVFGTGRVLRAIESAPAAGWLAASQNSDGSFGGDAGLPGTIEETAVAVDGLLTVESPVARSSCLGAIRWLCDRILTGEVSPAPIGLYFAQLWYYEKLYPWLFSAAALRGALERWKSLNQ